MTRIAKYLANLGIASRRDIEKMIADGRITLNGSPVTTPATFIETSDKKQEIRIDGRIPKELRHPGEGRGPLPRRELYIFHKPIGCLTTAKDPLNRKTIYDYLPPQYKNLKYIGRLDYNTSGLLLMTNDGELARKLTDPAAKIPRTYIAKLSNTISMDDAMFSRVTKPARTGIKIDGIIYRPVKIRRIDGMDSEITITEGKKNEIRIIFAHLGLPVRKLHRISYGEYKLPADLKPGHIVYSG